jgi:aspartate-semialdehyde dehydrogenase
MVGAMLKVLEKKFPCNNSIPAVSDDQRKEIEYKVKKYKVVGAKTAVDMKVDIVLFLCRCIHSSRLQQPMAGTTLIDNSFENGSTKKFN